MNAKAETWCDRDEHKLFEVRQPTKNVWHFKRCPNYLSDLSGIAFDETNAEPVLFEADNDGDMDLYLTSIYPGRGNHFYLNEGDGNPRIKSEEAPTSRMAPGHGFLESIYCSSSENNCIDTEKLFSKKERKMALFRRCPGVLRHSASRLLAGFRPRDSSVRRWRSW